MITPTIRAHVAPLRMPNAANSVMTPRIRVVHPHALAAELAYWPTAPDPQLSSMMAIRPPMMAKTPSITMMTAAKTIQPTHPVTSRCMFM